MFLSSSLGRSGVFVAALILSMSYTPELAAYGTADEACVKCHTKTSPGIVLQWRNSTHATSDVGCLACHGVKQSEVDSWLHEGQWISSIVTPNDCAECHEKECVEFAASHHNTAGLILHSKDNMLGEFVAGGPNAVLGCKQCHGSQIGFTKQFADGSTFRLDLSKVTGEVMEEIMANHNTDLKGLLKHKTELSEGIAKKVEALWAPHRAKSMNPENASEDRLPNLAQQRHRPIQSRRFARLVQCLPQPT